MEVSKLTTILCELAKAKGWDFQLRGRDLTHEEMFAFNGMLPGLAKRADQLALLCFGYGIGVEFEDVEASIIGYQLKLTSDASNVVRLACLYDVLNEIANSAALTGKVQVDELLYE